MDPRPYHFDYRRPRMSNPTFLSKELYDRIQQQQQQSPPPSPTKKQSSSPTNPELKRVNSTDFSSIKHSQQDNLSSRYNSRGNLSSYDKLNNSMANYGRNVLGTTRMQQEAVFERQERNFDIISYWPRSVQPTLRQFPKLTLEDKLFELDMGQSNHQ